MRSPISILISGGGLAVLRILVGVVRSKWIAHVLGLEGIGLLAQATQFQSIACSAASFSAAAALIQGAKGVYRNRELELFRCAILMILSGFVGVLLVVGFVGPSAITSWLFGPGHRNYEFGLVLLSVPFLLISSTYIESLFFINDRFDRYSINSALHSILQAVAFIVLVYFYKGTGLLLAIPTSAILLALIFYGDLIRLRLLNWRVFLPKWNRELAKYLLSFGTALFFIGVGGSLIQLSVRSLLVAKLGLAENGILQVPVALSAYGGAIVTNFVWGRIHPHFSTLDHRDPFELTFAIVAAFFVALGTWLAVPALIPIFYSKAFTPAVPLVGLQCAGDVLYFSFFTISVALLAMGKLKSYVAGWAFYFVPFTLALAFPSLLGTRQYFYIHFIASAAALASMLVLGSGKQLLTAPQCSKLAALSIGLASIMTTLALLNPEWIPARIALAAAGGTAGLLWWRLFYGAAVRAQLVDFSLWAKARMKVALPKR